MHDVARLQPTAVSLNVILKNTYFKDDILADGERIKLRIDYAAEMPFLVFKFPEPFYDFIQILSQQTITDLDWVHKNPVVVKLVMPDSVITDHLSTHSFTVGPEESVRLISSLTNLKKISSSEIDSLENFINSNTSKYLV